MTSGIRSLTQRRAGSTLHDTLRVPGRHDGAVTMTERASQFLQWAQETFGDIALDPHERTMRFIEEAVELAHAMGVDAALMATLIERVYSRPAGQRSREIGQCLATLELLSRVLCVNADQEATAELARVKTIPKEEWERRHGAKVALGIAR